LEAKAGGSKIKAILGYKVRPCLKKKKKRENKKILGMGLGLFLLPPFCS
jgi:hypothetical protein